MKLLKPIVLVEDNPKDLELTLIALDDARLVNEVVTCMFHHKKAATFSAALG